MPDKPTTAAGYRPEYLELVRSTCLYVATKLGDLMDDTVVVGGLVPSLLIDQAALAGVERVDRYLRMPSVAIRLRYRSKSLAFR